MSFLDRLKRILGGDASDGREPTARGARGGPGHTHDAATCQDALALLYDYLDGELQGVSAERVREHFEMCTMCYPHLRFEESFRAALHRAADGERAPDELKAHLLELLEKAGSEG